MIVLFGTLPSPENLVETSLDGVLAREMHVNECQAFQHASMLEALSAKLAPLHADLLSLLRECRAVHHLKQIHSLLITAGLSHSPLPTTKILNIAALSLPGDISYASLLFHHIKPQQNASSWNTMIRAYSIRSRYEEAITLYAQMIREGATPNKHTYPLVLKALPRSGHRNLNQIRAHIMKFGYDNDPFVQNSLLSCYANGGAMGSARQLFHEMCHRDVISWTALVHGCVRNGQEQEGLRIFMEMRLAGVQIDEVIVVSVLGGAGMVGNVWLGRCVHGLYIECQRVRWDVFVGSALVDMYGKCGYCDDARQVFDKMSSKNVVCWSALIAGYVQCSRFRDALSSFQDMLLERLRPSQVTLASVLTACAQLGALDQGRWVHGFIDRNKLEMNSVIKTALIDMYAKCGCIETAFRVFQSLSEKDVFPWTALINGLAMHGLASECLDLFSQMLEEGVQPNEVTFSGVLFACSHTGLVDQGKKYFDCMYSGYGIKPKVEHYGCMVDLLGRAGRLEEALHLIKSMPMEPTAGIWGALLGACMIHKDFVLGEKIGKYLVRMQPDHSGRYALLANMYSFSQNWKEAAGIRIAMRRRRMEKTPGWSWLEVDGVLHEFLALDESHFQSKDICETLHGMANLMKLEGCVQNRHPLLFEWQ